LGLLTAVVEVAKTPALEEALPHVADAALDVGLVLRPAHPRGVTEEAPLLAVLKKAAGGAGCQRVGPGHCRWEIVQDQALRHPTGEAPGCLQPSDALRKRLPEQWP